MNVTIAVEKGKPKDLKEFESINWPKSDQEHYGTTDLDFSRKKYYITARNNKKLLGFALVQTDAGVMSIEDLLVDYDYHRKGIGAKLLLEIENIATDKGCHVIELITGKNWNARKLYESDGYNILCDLPDYYAHRDFILMTKRLKL